jgi:uncharacterized membrane protein YfcA
MFMAATAWRSWQGILVLGSLIAPPAFWAAGAVGSIVDSRSILMVTAVFLGSVVVGASGFGSAAVAGALMLFWFLPVTAVPILLAASFTTQLVSTGHLWKVLRWRGCLPFVIGGLIGMPFGVLLLQHANPDGFRLSFGIFLSCWSGYLLLRPSLQFKRRGAFADGLVGLTGGITGGAIAFPGAVPAIWCAMTDRTKEEQRGITQMFILVMQFCTLAYLFASGVVGRGFLADYLQCLPAIIIGTFVGVLLFARINEMLFRQLVLALLLVAGVTHLITAIVHE